MNSINHTRRFPQVGNRRWICQSLPGHDRAMNEIRRLLNEQSGVIARRQALCAGLNEPDIKRLLRRKDWALVHPGVYQSHTGTSTWLQRAWAAVLYSWPAALSHGSALRAGDGPGRRGLDESRIHVAVDRSRNLVAPAGVCLHRMTGFGERVLWNLGPPRVRYEQAILDLAADARTDLDALGLMAGACGSRRTTTKRLLKALEERPRIARRSWLVSVLADISQGTCSVLEHGYLTKVERPHGLPKGRRQAHAMSARGSIFRDVEYVNQQLIVELDGRVNHDSAEARDRDLDRDLDAAVVQKETLRLGYGQVFDRGCVTATKVGHVLNRKGWAGTVSSCALCG